MRSLVLSSLDWVLSHFAPISLCVDSFVFISVYFVCFCFILHNVLYYCGHGGVYLMVLKPNP